MSHPRQPATLAAAERTTTALLNAIRARPRTTLATVALVVVTAGVAMKWSALVAAGVAPLLISALPCAVMCALGLCMSRMGRSTSSTETGTQEPTAVMREPVQFEPAAARSHEPEPSPGPASAIDGEAVAADRLQEQERRPTHA